MCMKAITLVLDSVAGPNVVDLLCVAEPWRSSMKPVRSPWLIEASAGAPMALGEISLYIHIGEFLTRVTFWS